MPEPYSLAEQAWLPVAMRSGKRDFVKLRDVVNPGILRIDTGRSDCDISLTEFLIGLVAISSLAPQEWREWLPRFHKPPTPEEIDAAIRPFAHALVLDGPGPRFFQDLEQLDGEQVPIAGLFIDAPAEYFVKPGGVRTLSRSGAAMALLTLQTAAPPGGRGNRTSLRGGGPVTTLVIPRVTDEEPSLWQTLWANVPPEFQVEPERLAQAIPWLTETRCSDSNGVATTPDDVHPAQAFFGMPRRIRLTFAENTSRLPCDLLGIVDDVIVESYITRPYGTNYTSWSRGHPLSPYYKPKKDELEWLPLHFKSSSVGYRQWTGLVLKEVDEAATRLPADAVALFLKERWSALDMKSADSHKVGVLACGYAMDNMKPLDFTEAFLPIITTGDTSQDRELAACARQMIAAANYAAALLGQTLNAALFAGNGKSDNSLLNSARARFWSGTENNFYSLLRKAAANMAVDVRPEWLEFVRRSTLRIFDDMAPLDEPESLDIKDLVEARTLLLRSLHGKKFYSEAGLPPPENSKSKRRAA